MNASQPDKPANKARQNSRAFSPAKRMEQEASGEMPPIPFPSECLPPVLRRMTEAVAELERLPCAMTGPMVLAAASMALGRGAALEGLRGKRTPANLYVCVCKESGTGGSTAFRHITKPIEGMQARILREFRKDTLPMLEAQKRTLTTEATAAESEYKTANKSDDHEAKAAALKKLTEVQKKLRKIEDDMREPLLCTSDSTPEALAEKLAANNCTLAQMNPDAGDTFSSMLGCYRDKSARDGSHALWLKCYSNENHTITRTRGTVALESPWLAMLLVVTPNTARRHLEDTSLLETGFLGRLLLCDPQAKMTVGTFEEELATPALPSEIAECYEAALWKALAFYRRPRALPWADEDPDGDDTEFKAFVVKSEEDAKRVIHEDLKRQAENWHEAESERELIARQTEQALRIALVLHIFQGMTFTTSKEATWSVKTCTGHEQPLTAATMRNAIIIRDWFNHSLSQMMAGQKAAAKDEAFSKLQVLSAKHGWERSGITPRDLVTHKVGGVHRSEGARKLLEQWTSEGKLQKRDREAKGTGRKPEPAYYLPPTSRQTRP